MNQFNLYYQIDAQINSCLEINDCIIDKIYAI